MDFYLLYLQESNVGQRIDLTDIKRVKHLDKLNKLNLPKHKYMIVSSGTMALYGLREMRDLDLVVTDDIFESLRKHRGVIRKTYPDPPGYYYEDPSGNIEIYKGLLSLKMPAKEALKHSIVVDGYKFGKLEIYSYIEKKIRTTEGQKRY